MNTILVLIALILMCGTISATNIDETEHYMIVVLIWNNETGELEAGVPVTFAGTHTLYTGSDGSIVYDTANIGGVEHGANVSISCKYGLKHAPIIYATDGVRNWGTAVTFNEPDEDTVIAILAAMGLAATAIGGGVYILRKKKKTTSQEVIMKEEPKTTDGWKLKRDFGVRALIATLSIGGYISVIGLAAYRGDTTMIADISKAFMPIMLLIVGFYYSASMIRDGR